jgi:hypothetical protein
LDRLIKLGTLFSLANAECKFYAQRPVPSLDNKKLYEYLTTVQNGSQNSARFFVTKTKYLTQFDKYLAKQNINTVNGTTYEVVKKNKVYTYAQ